jgi:AmmeMemoRadiSam system protein B/AmmeMemoRadiSam system protein A
MAAVHVSPFGGSWYPGRPADLGRLLDELFESSRERTGPYLYERPLGFVVPHAGLHYSGQVAAAAYRHLCNRHPRRAVILGFAHRGGPAGVSIPDISEYQTPLGRVRVDRGVTERLAGHLPFEFAAEDRICDHSVEIQLPLLQWAAPDAEVVPLFVGDLDSHERDSAAQVLAELCAEDTIFLVSSDLTHYGRAFGYQPFPADKAISERLQYLDGGLMEAVASLDMDLFLGTVRDSRSTVCGVAPISLWLRTLAFVQGSETFQQMLDYQTSGEITGDYRHCVSYAALGYFPAESFLLGAEDQAVLLESARETLEHLRCTRDPQPFPPREVPAALTRKTGVFVSLHQEERLLGCVGTRTARDSLAETVPEMTLRAALDDPRFPTVLGVEGRIDIELSILSPLKPICDPRAFRVNEHGASLELGGRQGLLLPQVATGRGWTAEQFLSALCAKAALQPNGYRNPAVHLSVFRAQVFSSSKAAAA